MKSRIKAMVDLDIDTARTMSVNDFTDSQILAGLHKARIHMHGTVSEITDEMVIESREYLQGMGMLTTSRTLPL